MPEAMLGAACLTSAVLLVVSVRRRSAGTRTDWPRLEAALGLFLFLCGAAQAARAVASSPHSGAISPITAGLACWAAAFTLRTNRSTEPVVAATVVGPACSDDPLNPPVLEPPDSSVAGESAPTAGPQGTDHPAPAPTRPGSKPRPPGRRVLIVDDDESSAQIMAMILRLDGHEVRLAGSVPSALELIPGYRPEVVLSDIGLPGLDGHELARRIRHDPELSDGLLLLAALTGFAGAEARVRCREAGFDHHLVKPVDPEAILTMLASLQWQEPTARNAVVALGR
ncbi:MAG: response regulator [Isosphaeraceae bacterium]